MKSVKKLNELSKSVELFNQKNIIGGGWNLVSNPYPSATTSGWHLVGNPYPAPVSTTTITSTTNMQIFVK
ncbi:MAG: hypothetical protein IPJ81_17270 [Chitinophagaceae bacterium]|nr:hypothetical protein [Chitinophagaceae bacterium]